MAVNAIPVAVAMFVQLVLGLGVLLWALAYVYDKVLTWFLGFIRVHDVLVRFARSYYAHKRKKSGEPFAGVYRPKLKGDD